LSFHLKYLFIFSRKRGADEKPTAKPYKYIDKKKQESRQLYQNLTNKKKQG